VPNLSSWIIDYKRGGTIPPLRLIFSNHGNALDNNYQISKELKALRARVFADNGFGGADAVDDRGYDAAYESGFFTGRIKTKKTLVPGLLFSLFPFLFSPGAVLWIMGGIGEASGSGLDIRY